MSDQVYKLIHDHKNEILDTGDWWWAIEGYDINVHCADDENFEDPSAVFNISLYRLDLGDTSSYTSNVQHDLELMTRREIRLL
jgi:hypothetical protein